MRHRKGIEMASFNVTLNKDVADLIDKYAKTLGLSRAQMVRNLIASGLQDAKVLKATGVMDVVGAIRAMKPKQVVQVEAV